MWVIAYPRMSSTVCLEKVVSVMSVLAKMSLTQTREQIDSQDIFIPFTCTHDSSVGYQGVVLGLSDGLRD